MEHTRNIGESQAATGASPPDAPGPADETLPALRDSFEPVPLRARHVWDAVLRQGFRDRVRPLLLDKALNGTIVRRYYHGKLIAEDRVHSERLLLRLLDKGETLFAADADAEAMLGDWDGAMARLESGAFEGGFRLWRDRWGHWLTNFPPPPGFDNYAGEPSDPDFERALTEAEEEALAAQQETRLETGEAARDRFFGFTPRGRVKDRRSRLKER